MPCIKHKRHRVDSHPFHTIIGGIYDAGHEHAISEVVYIPVYDQEKLEEGVFAVVEVMLASETSESMAVANLITYASRFMEDVSVSL